jgi:hypothetical protein
MLYSWIKEWAANGKARRLCIGLLCRRDFSLIYPHHLRTA